MPPQNTIKTSFDALVIGGANIDSVGIPDNRLILHDSNPGVIKTSLGGVGRNIAENLAKLGVNTKLLSIVGDDAYGRQLIEQTQATGVDMSAVEISQTMRTSTYFCVLDKNEDMAVALADMSIVEHLTPTIIQRQQHLIEQASIVVLDTNLPQETLDFILSTFTTTRFMVDTVSVHKTKKIQHLLHKIDTLKPNRLEAEALTGIDIKGVDDAFQAAHILIDQGVQHVFLSLGQHGLVYKNQHEQYHVPCVPVDVVNATGAGDAMMASIVYGQLHNMPTTAFLPFACAASAVALAAETTIAPDFSVDTIMQLC